MRKSKDKRSTQLTLPLNADGQKIKSIVKQHWNVTFARQGKISVVSKRIIALVLAQIQDNDLQLKQYYQIRSSEVICAAELSGRSAYGEVKKALDELATQVWSIEDIKSETYYPKQLINTCVAIDGYQYGYNSGLITVIINPFLEPYFVQMAHYSQWEIKNYMKFKSWYSMRIWEILSAFRDKEKYHVSIAEFRLLMDCEKKYKDINRLVEKTLAEPLEDLKDTDLAFEVTKVYSKLHGRGRPPVVGLELIFTNKPKDPIEILDTWAVHSPRHKRLLEQALNRWKIKPANLVKYLPRLGIDRFAGMLKEFELKEASPKKIGNKAKYCNTVFTRTCDGLINEEA